MELQAISSILIVLLSTFNLNDSNSVEAQRLVSYYGETCNSTLSCESTRNLTCHEGKCQCVNPETMRYDPDKESCLEEKCSCTATPTLVSAGSPCIDAYGQDAEKCVLNASCNRTDNLKYDLKRHGYYHLHVCHCNSDFYQTPNGTCEEKLGPDGICTKHEQCRNDSVLSLSCISGLCKCTNQDLVYDPVRKDCSCKIGATSCTKGNHCGTNAIYNSSINYCECLEGYTINEDGICHPSFGNSCGNPNLYISCNSGAGLVCVNKKCNCGLGEHGYFSEDLGRCLAFVNGPCEKGDNSCTPGAECVKIGQGRQQCQCRPGFLPVDGKCEIGYGFSCDDQIQEFSQCDHIGGLNCINGFCKCGVFQEYNQNELRCRGLVGSVCQVDNKGFCLDGAICKSLRNFRNVNKGICECDEDFFMNEDGTCSGRNATVN